MRPMVVPIPQVIASSEESFQFTRETVIAYSPGAQNIAEYLARWLRPSMGFHLPLLAIDDDKYPADSIALALQNDQEDSSPEGYRLQVSAEHIHIRAQDPRGLFYGVQTMRLLLPLEVEARDVTEEVNWRVDGVTVEDWPQFKWRGLHLDVGRHFYPLPVIKKFLDLMALQKFNVFHWHLTEDQGWRVEIKKYPRLTEVGAFRQSTPIPADRNRSDNTPYGGYYTQDDVREVVAYAAERFITVVPEIEIPGHALATLAAYPQFGCVGSGYEVGTKWGIYNDVFCAGNDDLYPFLEDILDEVMALFPGDFIHIGGDECPKVRWQVCQKCQKKISTAGLVDEDELQSYVIRRMERYLNENGRRLIGWDEILEGGLAPNATVMSWRGVQGGIHAATAGHDVVMTPNTHCYLDYYQSEDIENEPPAIGGFISLEKAYQFDPLQGIPADKARNVLGGQGNLWTEYIPAPAQLEYMAYPRATGLAEVLWSGPGRDYDEFLRRLPELLERFDALDVNYRALDNREEPS